MKPKTGFVTPLRVEHIDYRYWKMLDPLVWVGSHDPPDIFTVPAGDRTDFATVPWFVQFILPRTGKWTKPAVLHDRMCNELRDHHRYPDGYPTPKFTSIDADAIFRSNARAEGTDIVRAELLWFGVRCGSLWDAHRRDEWLKTFPRYFFDLIWILAVLFGIGYLIFWLA